MSESPIHNTRRAAPVDAGPSSSDCIDSAGMPVLPGSPIGDEPCGVPDPYAGRLAPNELEPYEGMTADTDLSFEIRLIRTVLAVLTADLEENHAAVARVAQTLLRAIHQHARQSGSTNRLQAALDEAGERVIHDAQAD